MNKEDIIWKEIVGYEGLYEISNQGEIRTIKHIATYKNVKRIIPSCIRKKSINVNGYYYVRLSKGNKQKNVLVHKALMEAFVPNPENKPFVDHINTIRTDNRLENLRWVTSKENTNNPLTIKHIIDACSTDDCKDKQRKTKERLKLSSYNPKRIYQYSLKGDFIAEYPSQMDAIRKLGLKQNCVGNIKVALDNRNRTAYGFMWTTFKVERIEKHI